MRVTDLGTGFDVRLEPDGVAVAVKHGLVRIDDPDAAPPVSERLDPGEWIQVSRGGQTTRGDEPVEQVAAWREGRLIARDQPVSEVVDALRPYFPGLILVTGSALAGRHVTASTTSAIRPRHCRRWRRRMAASSTGSRPGCSCSPRLSGKFTLTQFFLKNPDPPSLPS